MNAPVLGKIDKRRLQRGRGDRLIGTVVVLEVPTAPQSPETTVTLFERPGFQQLPTGCRRPRVGQGSHERLAGVDMLGMAGEQVPELDEPRLAFRIIASRLGADPPQEGYPGIDVARIGSDPPPQDCMPRESSDSRSGQAALRSSQPQVRVWDFVTRNPTIGLVHEPRRSA